MDKVTQVNIEGHNYGFVAGQSVEGLSGAAATDYVKTITLTENTNIVEGMVLLVTFTNANTAGIAEPITIYSSNGENFYYDEQMTEEVVFPPVQCYVLEHTTGNEYSYMAFVVFSVSGETKPLCYSNGKPAGGNLWSAGDSVMVVNFSDRFIMMASTHIEVSDEVQSGDMHPVTSNAVAQVAANKLGAKKVGSYWGMTDPDGADNVYIRTTSNGIIPSESGGRTAGHGNLGTSSWYFGEGYVQKMWVSKLNLSSTAGTENGDIWII